MTELRRGPKAKFTSVVQVGIEPSTRKRVQDIVERAPARYPSFAQALREAIDTGLPVMERDIDDREQRYQDIRGIDDEAAVAEAIAV